MRRILWLMLAIIVAALVVGWFYRDMIGFMLMQAKVTPKEAFSDDNVPAPPYYADAADWAALPSARDGADLVIQGATKDRQASAQADAFYIHPTNLVKNTNWNAPLDDPEARELVEKRYLEAQASVFNECCRVYAPRYRAAAFAAFLDRKGSGAKAIDVAFSDIAAAFDHFLAHYNEGRPIVLAAHSQGSLHLVRLLQERIKGTDIAARIVAAYAVGWPLDSRNVSLNTSLPVCDAPDRTGCLLSWNTVGPKAATYYDPTHNVCVNPLSWQTDGAHADDGDNRGALVGRTIKADIADAQCIAGRLIVKDLRAPEMVLALKAAPIYLGRDVYHVYDYNLFYVSIRENAAARVAAFLAAAQKQAPAGAPSPSNP